MTITTLLLGLKYRPSAPLALSPQVRALLHPLLSLSSAAASRLPWRYLLPASAALLYASIFAGGYTEESLLAVPGLGVQISSTSWIDGSSCRFIPTSRIGDLWTHEGFYGFEVRFYLAVVVEGEEGLVVVFPVGLSPLTNWEGDMLMVVGDGRRCCRGGGCRSWCGGERNGVWMNRSALAPELGMVGKDPRCGPRRLGTICNLFHDFSCLLLPYRPSSLHLFLLATELYPSLPLPPCSREFPGNYKPFLPAEAFELFASFFTVYLLVSPERLIQSQVPGLPPTILNKKTPTQYNLIFGASFPLSHFPSAHRQVLPQSTTMSKKNFLPVTQPTPPPTTVRDRPPSWQERCYFESSCAYGTRCHFRYEANVYTDVAGIV